MFLKPCTGRKSCLDPIPNIFMIFKKLKHSFFFIKIYKIHFIKSWNRPPAQSHVFCNFSSFCRRQHFYDFMTDNESKKLTKFHRPQKTRKPQKSIIQKRPILALFDPPYIGQYAPVSAMELKWSFLRGPAHKIEKRPFFAKKREVEEKKKGFEVSTCLQ